MTTKIEDIVSDAIRQGWKKTPGAKHWKLWTPDSRRWKLVPHRISEAAGSDLFEKDMRKLGWRPTEEIKAEEKEKNVASVQDLIKANGSGESIAQVKPPVTDDKYAHLRKPRISRAGMEETILTVLRGAYPNEVDFTTLKMKVSMQHPGVNATSIHTRLIGLKASGKVLNHNKGYYRAAGPDVRLDPTQTQEAPQNLEPVLPEDVLAVVNNFKLAMSEMEKLVVRMNRQIAENNEAAETIKRLAAKL